MGLEYSIETLNLNVVRKRSGSNSSRKNIRESNTSIQNSNYELGSSVPGLEVRSQSVAATVLDSVLFGNTVQGELTMVGCAVNLIKAAWGSALLTLPRTAWFMGWAGTVLVIMVMGFIGGLQCHVMNVVCELAEDISRKKERNNGGLTKQLRVSSFEQVAGCLWGKRGYQTMAVLMNFVLFLIANSYTILMGKYLHRIYPNWSTGYWISVLLIFLIPMGLLKNMAQLSKLSFLGVLASLVTIVSIMCNSMMVKSINHPAQAVSFEVSEWPIALVMTVFCFGSVLVTPTCRRDMKNPYEMPTAIAISHFLLIGVYTFLGLFCVFGFGSRLAYVENDITELMKQDLAVDDIVQEDPNPYEYISTTEPLATTPVQVYVNSTGDILSQILTNNDLNVYGWLTILFTVPSLLLTHPLLMNCVFSAFERTWELPWYFNTPLRVAIIMLGAGIAIACSEMFLYFSAFLAAFFMTPIEMIFPFMSFWILKSRIHNGFLKALHKQIHHAVLHIPVFLIAMFVWGLGTFAAVLNILRYFEVITADKVGGF